MRAVILGGTGQVGLATAERLVTLGAHVTIVSRTRPKVVPSGAHWQQGDITDGSALKAALEKHNPECVIHLASYLQFACEENPREAVRVNIDGTVNVLDACRALDVKRVIFGSSIAAYGARDDLMRESDAPTADTSIYGMTKWMGEAIGARYEQLYGLRFIALRYSGVFGPAKVHTAGMALVRQKIKECALGHDVVIYGASGDERIHLTHITDVAEATCRAALHPNPGYPLYNVAGPAENYVTLKEFYNAVRALIPSAGAAIWHGRGRTAGPVETSRLRSDLGVAPHVSYVDGLTSDLESLTRTDAGSDN